MSAADGSGARRLTTGADDLLPSWSSSGLDRLRAPRRHELRDLGRGSVGRRRRRAGHHVGWRRQRPGLVARRPPARVQPPGRRHPPDLRGRGRWPDRPALADAIGDLRLRGAHLVARRDADRLCRSRAPGSSGRSWSSRWPAGRRGGSRPTASARRGAADRRQRWQPRQNEVMKPPALTSVILVPQRGQACPPLSWTARKSRTCFSNVGGTRPFEDLDGVREGRARSHIERVDLLGGQARPLAERQEPGGVEDLVAVGVPDARDERLVAEQVLELAGMSPDPIAPHLERQGRVVGFGALLASGRARGPADRRRRVEGRSCPSASGPGSGAPGVASGAGIQSAPRVHRAASRGGPFGRVPKPRTTAVLVGSLAPGAASWNRPVSIGLHTISSRSRSISMNFPSRRIDRRAGRSGRRAPQGYRERRAVRVPRRTEPDGPPAPRGGRRRPRSDRVIRARPDDCSARKACARLSRPREAGQLKSYEQA